MAKRTLDSLSIHLGDEDELHDAEPRKMARSSAASSQLQVATRRRTTSCAACRKQKIKCELLSSGPPCERCKRKGVECIINTGLRNSILDQRQLAALRRDLGHMHASLERACLHLNIDMPLPLETPLSNGDVMAIQQGPEGDFGNEEDDACELSAQNSPMTVQAPMDSYLVPAKSDASPPGPLQSGSSNKARAHKRPDIVSKGLISHEDADSLVQYYISSLDPILYELAGAHRTTDAMRDASPTLLAVVCTVAALHDVSNNHLYDVCYREFRHSVSTALFEKRDFDELRALCIGTFWLPDTSRILLCDAVRRAGDARVHRLISRACSKAVDEPPASAHVGGIGRTEARARVRLWYALFMCDQHLSVLYNRDNLVRQDKDILNRRLEFLACDDATVQDLRLVAQVTLLLLMIRIKDTFGSEYPTPVPEHLSSQVQRFSDEFDAWIAKFHPQFRPEPALGEFPYFAFPLHYHFGKLYLGHHFFRGLQDSPIPPTFIPAASMAHEASVAIFDLILQNEGLRCNLAKVPAYIPIMISFAGHFLLELCLRHREQLGINVEDDYLCVNSVVSSLRDMPTAPQHPLSRVTDGLAKRLVTFAAAYGTELLTEPSVSRMVEREGISGECLSAPMTDLIPGEVGPMFGLENAGMPDEFTYTDLSDFAFRAPLPNFTM